MATTLPLVLDADVSLRHDPVSGLWRWLCKCGAGTGVTSGGDVDDRLTPARAHRLQWSDYLDANTGRIGHAVTHR